MKLKYKISRNNQLAIIKNKEVLTPKGNFTVNSNNQLTYEVKESTYWRERYNISKRITFKGKWSIDKKHNLLFTLSKTKNQLQGEKLLLNTKIIKVKADYLVFSLGTKGGPGTHELRLLQLKGRWQADKYNRLQFLVKKIKTSDTLTFQGSWQIKNNSLLYTYQRASLVTKTKRTHILRFKGYWQINNPNQLTYILDVKGDSSFTFKVYLETPSLIGRKGVIKYRVGIGLKGSRLFKSETISLYGVWKLHRKTGLSFDIDYEKIGVKAISFGAFVKINNNKKITFKLRSREGKSLGMSVEFIRSFLKNKAKWFLKVMSEKKQPRLEWGITIPW